MRKKEKKNSKKKIFELFKNIFMIIGIIMIICFFTKIKGINNQIDFVKNKIPDELNKQFYMENNGSYGYIANLSNGYMIDKHTLILPSITNCSFTTNKTLSGLISSLFCYITDTKYQIHFNENYSYGNIDLVLFNLFKIPKSVVNFTISKIENSPDWLRESKILGFKSSYIFKNLESLNEFDLNQIPKSALIFR